MGAKEKGREGTQEKVQSLKFRQVGAEGWTQSEGRLSS